MSEPFPKSKRFRDLTGVRFGRLVVVSYEGRRKMNPCFLKQAGRMVRGSQSLWRCRCDCGAFVTHMVGRLTSGNTRSCGCLRRELELAGGANRTHGKSKTREYRIWKGILARCCNKNTKAYPYYGGRGIKVCPEWRHDFARFIADMGPSPTHKHTVERIDNNKGYEPSNCRWALHIENCRNTRSIRPVTFGGKTRCLGEWAEISGVPQKVIQQRLRMGWSVKRAIFESPLRTRCFLKKGVDVLEAATIREKKAHFKEALAKFQDVLSAIDEHKIGLFDFVVFVNKPTPSRRGGSLTLSAIVNLKDGAVTPAGLGKAAD